MYTDLAEALADTKGVIWQLSDNDLMKAKLQLLRLVKEIDREQNLRTMCVHQENQKRVDQKRNSYVPPFADLEQEEELMKDFVY
jgi:hypothetical protein